MERLLALAREGPVRTRDLVALGLPRAYLGRLVERGVLERIAPGVYRLANSAAAATRARRGR